MDLLARLQTKLAERTAEDPDPGFATRLCLARIGEEVHVDFFGDPFDEPYAELMEALIEPEVAGRLATLPPSPRFGTSAGRTQSVRPRRSLNFGRSIGAAAVFSLN